jgi:hypothetical protein
LRSPRHVLVLVVIVFWVGCAAGVRREETSRQVRQVFAECTQKHQATGYVPVARCAEGPVRGVYDGQQYPYMDLVDLYLAYWASIAQKVDGGQLSPEEAQVQLLEQLSKLTTEAQRRDGQYDNYRVLLMELRPPLPPRR